LRANGWRQPTGIFLTRPHRRANARVLKYCEIDTKGRVPRSSRFADQDAVF